MRTFLFAIAGIAAFAFAAPSVAEAHPPGGYGGGYGGYGVGGHDFAPHWHQTVTPYGSYSSYGNGMHDFVPHDHGISPWGGLRSYSATPFGYTKSYNGFPGYYGGYGGGYGPYWR